MGVGKGEEKRLFLPFPLFLCAFTKHFKGILFHFSVEEWKKKVSVLFMKGKSSSVPGSALGSSGFGDQTPQQMGHTQPHFPLYLTNWLVVLEVLVKAGYPTPHTCLLLDQECCQRRELVQLAPNNPHHLLPTTSFPCLLREDLRLLRHAPGVCLFPF